MPDRAEVAGGGAALLFHVALIAALTLSLARVADVPESPSMDVELVDEIALAAAAPATVATPPPAATTPPEPLPAAAIEPLPSPQRVVPQPAQATPRPERPRPAPTPRESRLGEDFLKGIKDSPSEAPAKPAAATFDAAAKADIASAISRQIQPCAERQRALGTGANRIRVVLNLRLFLNGRLKGTPRVVRTSGVDEDNAQYEELVVDQAIASYRQCAPLRLPAELYQTPQGGWSNINMTYRVP